MNHVIFIFDAFMFSPISACQHHRLLAHVYMIIITQLATGNRIGSVCVEKLNLFEKNAMSTYVSFPEEAKNPMLTFNTAVNELGRALSGQVVVEKEFFDQLMDAAARCSLFFLPLAKSD